MATADSPAARGQRTGNEPSAPINSQPPVNSQPLHRIRSVREQQGVSLRSVARVTRMDMRSLRSQELESSDLRLSDLRRWQKALDVPLAELLVEPEGALSRPVRDRAQLVRLMKTALAMRDAAESPAMLCMVKTLIDQLLDIMPELKDVTPWHSYGQRRSLDDYGRVAQREISTNSIASWDED